MHFLLWVLQRYYGWYANRTCGIRRTAAFPEQPSQEWSPTASWRTGAGAIVMFGGALIGALNGGAVEKGTSAKPRATLLLRRRGQ